VVDSNTYFPFNICGLVLQHCAYVITTDNWVAGMVSWLLDLSYYTQTSHGLSALTKFIQFNTALFAKYASLKNTVKSFVRKYPLSAVPCKRTLYRGVVHFQITSLCWDKNYTQTLLSFSGEAWCILNRKVSSQNNSC
jgi:hypothetical protein